MPHDVTVERAYAARRIDSGLYLQPSNDGKRWFVIARYEDGMVAGLADGPWRATRWAWGPITEAQLREVERTAGFDTDSALSDMKYAATGHEGDHETKRAAVDAALLHDATHG